MIHVSHKTKLMVPCKCAYISDNTNWIISTNSYRSVTYYYLLVILIFKYSKISKIDRHTNSAKYEK